MCKFHKDVARDIATDPVTGLFDPGKYSIALVAMAKFRIEQYMPPMHGCDGFVPSAMITDTAQSAFKASGLAKSDADIKAYRNSNINMLRQAIAETATRHDVSLAGLGIPDNITKDGYKHCDMMPADITKSGPFLDEAVVQLYKGYDDAGKSYASGELSLLDAAHKPAFAALHAATADFMAQPQVTAILKQMFENSLATVFQTAQADVDAGCGLQKTDGCVMCHDHSDETKPAVVPVVAEPKGLRKLFATCSSCASTGGSTALGVLASHIPCILTPIIAAATGVALGGAFMMAAMMVVSPVVAVAATYGIDRWRGQKTSVTKAGMVATAALAISFTIATLNQHKHGSCCDDMPGTPPASQIQPGCCGMPSMQHH